MATIERVEIRSTMRAAFSQETDVLNDDEWNTYELDFTPESLILRNDSDVANLYYRDDEDCDIHTILPGETYETSLETATSFQLLGGEDDQDYRAWARIN